MNAVAEEVKKVPFLKKDWTDEGVVTFAFGNGTTLEFDTRKCNEEIRFMLLCHGASQKIGDAAAGAKGDYNAGISSCKDVISTLLSGQWSGEREGGPRLADLAEAIARIKNVALEKARAAVEKASDDDRKKWRSNTQVKAVMAQITAEKAQAALAASAEEDLEISV